MSAHQTNQPNSGTQYTQYAWGDQVLEIPSNITNYQLENVMSGGVS